MTNPSYQDLLRSVEALRDTVRREGDALFRRWSEAIGNRRMVPAVCNLACYLALRRHDISDLQAALAVRGLSSLGRSEGHVMASLDTLHAALARISGEEGAVNPPPGRMRAGRNALRRGQQLFFGPDVIGASTRIMVTLPTEAASDRTFVRSLLEAGMTCARINCAHDDAATWRAMAEAVRTEAAALGRVCRVLMDVGGPKCRIETVHAAGKVRVFRGDQMVLVRDLSRALASDQVIVTISYPEIIDDLAPGREVWIDDGKIGLRITGVSDGRVELEVFRAREKGEKLRPEKGVNFPGTELRLSPLTEKDLRDLDVIVDVADSVGFSFVQKPEDLVLLHGELARRRPDRAPLPVILKIETPLAVRNLPVLIVQAMARGPVAVMIARGDLAVELGFARMSEIQEEIMWLAEAAQVPVVWATQVLDSLVSDGSPSRAEATDAAMAQRAECVMLNKGPFLPDGIRFLADVLCRMDRHQAKKSPRFGLLHSWPIEDLGLL